MKKVVTEPKGTGDAFDAVMKEYYGAVRKGQGGLFMAVCRGKVGCPDTLMVCPVIYVISQTCGSMSMAQRK